MSNEIKVTSNKQKVRSNEQKLMSNEQKRTSNEQQAKVPPQHFQLFQRRPFYRHHTGNLF